MDSAASIRTTTKWVDFRGNPTAIGSGATVTPDPHNIDRVLCGDLLAGPSTLCFRDPNYFRAGELHEHPQQWARLIGEHPTPQQAKVLTWIKHKVAVQPYFQHFRGEFKGEVYDSAQPPPQMFRNNASCKPFVPFVQQTILDRLQTGAISLLGRLGQVPSPHLILPLTVEPGKPRLCYDARFLNLWIIASPFKLDRLCDLPRYVFTNSYQTVLDDKSGYDHLLLTEDSRTFFGIQWGGWLFSYNTLPFGWKTSPYVYHTTGLVASHYFRSKGIPCLLYIDDRHTGQLQVPLSRGAYALLDGDNARNFAAANSAIFVVASCLIALGYFLGLEKSIMIPRQMVPYLGFTSDSIREVFHLLSHKKEKFLALIREVLATPTVTVKTLQRLVGKCVSFSLVVPAALLFTREMNAAIRRGIRTSRPLPLSPALREEIAHWLFLQTWDDPLPWRDERHVRVQIASDASGSGWGGSILSASPVTVSDYWTHDELTWDISVREAVALDNVLLAFSDQLSHARVDAVVDNQAVVHAWHSHGGRSVPLTRAIKRLFFTTAKLNVSLHLSYIPTGDNPADLPSRRLSSMDSCLHPRVWRTVQSHFGGPYGHTCDLMALDSNVMTDLHGQSLPHFTPGPSPQSSGINLFAQELFAHNPILAYPYVFPPLSFVGPVLRFLRDHRLSCTLVTMDVYPRKYWWPLLHYYSSRSIKLDVQGSQRALLIPSRSGWTAHSGIPGDLWCFALSFAIL